MIGQLVDAHSNSDSPVMRILIVDDHPLMRDGIAALVATQQDMELVAEAATGQDGIEQFHRHRPDITLMDLQLPDQNGIDVISAIRQNTPEARIIILTTYSGDVQVASALEAGARAYLLKSALHAELLDTIRAVHAGRKTVSPSLAAELAAYAGGDILTVREIAVLRLVGTGHANKEIAARLSVTEDTVKGRVKTILSKLHAKDRTHAVTIGLERGILHL